MSSQTKFYGVRPKLSSSTTASLMLTYKPIILLLIAGPSFIMSLPFVAMVLRIVFGTVTGQHALLTICMTAFLSKIVENSITTAAPTKELAIKSLERSRGLLLFAMFSMSIFIIQFIVVPLMKMLGLESILTCSASVSVLSAIRLSIGGFLLGLAVVARYIGPQSIVRCSSSPLLINPYVKTFRRLFPSTRSSSSASRKRCFPDDSREAQFSEGQDLNPRRQQLPTSASLSAQIVITIMVAISVAFASVLPFARGVALGNIQSSTKMTVIFSCITPIALQLLSTTRYGTNHEINPMQYQPHSMRNRDAFIKFLSTAVVNGFAVLFLAIFVHFRNASFQWSDDLVYFVCVPPAIILYLCTFDHALRILICTTPSNMKKFVEEAAGGDVCIEIFVDVILRSLLHSNDDLVKRLGHIPTNSSMCMNIEQEELKLNNYAIKTMVHTLLQKTNEDEASPHLEDDILRLAILSCIEDSILKEGTSIGNSTEIDFVHGMKSVPNKAKGRSNSIDPIVVPIVRALCAYAGGLGEALSLISDSDGKMLNDTWVLPPGALFMGECAIRGATHCIFQGIDFPRSGTNLAFFIPVLLNSACKLYNGLLRYQQATNGSTALDETCKAKLSPQFLPLFHACNNCADILLQTAKVNEGFRTLDFLKYLDIDGRKWLESKMAASVHVDRSMHVGNETSPN